MKKNLPTLRTKAFLSIVCITVLSFFMVKPAHSGNLLQKGLDFLSGAGQKQSPGELTRDEISEAFKQALRLGSEKVVSQLGQKNGFYEDPVVHIPLPKQFEVVK